jgi:hypothetical protein
VRANHSAKVNVETVTGKQELLMFDRRINLPYFFEAVWLGFVALVVLFIFCLLFCEPFDI